MPRPLTAAEALCGFLGWLTSREEPVTLSATHDAGVARALLDRFMAVNDCGSLGEDWPDCSTQPDPTSLTNQAQESFSEELQRLINRHSLENGSNTPDWILAAYLTACLQAWNAALQARDRWYGHPAPIATITLASEAPP